MSNNRYQPGQSGNPKGRPKGARGIAQQFLAEVSRMAEGEPGSPGQITRLQQLIRAQVDKATKGDNRAIEKVLERMEALDAKLDAANSRGLVFTAADREVIEEIWRRLSADD
jgi:hypothetical protein